MGVRFDKLGKLELTRLERLLAWGIQRQLRWAVLMVSALVALLQLYFQISKYYFLIHSIDSIKLELLGLIVILSVVTFGLCLCEARAIDYYYYVAKIEEIWGNHKSTGIRLQRIEVFTFGKRLDNFIMTCPRNAKLFFISISLSAVFLLFILPLPL